MSTAESLRDVFGARVRVRGMRIGQVSGVVLDSSETRAIGLEVTAVDGHRRFLPWVAATISNGIVDADSALVLADTLDAYVERGAVVCHDLERLESFTAGPDGYLLSPLPDAPVVSRGVLTGTYRR